MATPLFTIFFMTTLSKGCGSSAWPAGAELRHAADSLADAKSVGGVEDELVCLLLPVLPPLSHDLRFTVMALVFFSPQIKAMGSHIDFEQILPDTLSKFMPAGVLGLVLAGLLALHVEFCRDGQRGARLRGERHLQTLHQSECQPRTLVIMSYVVSWSSWWWASLFGLHTRDINQVTQWIVSALWGGYTAANISSGTGGASTATAISGA